MSKVRNLSAKDDLLCRDLATWSMYQRFDESSNPALAEDRAAWTLRLTVLLKEMDMVNSIKSTGRAAGLTVIRVLGQPGKVTSLTQTNLFHLIPLRLLGGKSTAGGIPLLLGQVVHCVSTIEIISAVELLCITEHDTDAIRVAKKSVSDGGPMDVIHEEM